MEVKSESEVAQLSPTLSDPMDCSPPGSSVHGIFQARVLEWGAITFSVYLLTKLDNNNIQEIPWHPSVRTPSFYCRRQFLSRVGELRSCKPCCSAKKINQIAKIK